MPTLPIRDAAAWARVTLAGALLCGSMALTGCGPQPSPATVLAFTASAAEPAASITSFEEDLTSHALKSRSVGDGAVDVVVAGQDSVAHLDLTPVRGNEVESDEERAREKVDANLTALKQQVVGVVAGTGDLDLLSLLDRAAQHTSAGGLVFVQSSGVQTVAPLDFRKLGWNFAIDKIVADLEHDDLLPDLTGRHVRFSGLGTASGTQPSLPRPNRSMTQNLWMAVCQAGGAASCTSVEKPVELTATLASLKVPTVPVSELDTTCHIGAVEFPAAANFQGDSPVLDTKRADLVLAPLARQLTNCPTGARVTVTGHAADAHQDSVDGVDLSTDRAEAVHRRLIELGAPEEVFGAVHGVGDTEPKVDNWPNGHYSEPLASLNRRVDIAVTTP
ncbi:OmpA family protein [Nocardia takedensis]|uniref:OmpA family protein n=1 Tax=Nocardia takedensis TaxID=259390 RepID=UPI003F75FF4B